jgi:hypothetical protein
MRYPIAICAGVFFAVLQLAGAAQASVYVTGQVLVSNRRAPAAGVTIALYAPTETDTPLAVVESLQNGSFVLKAPAAGAYRLVIDGPAYTRLEQSIDVPAAGISARRFTVDHLPSIRVQLIGSNGQPVTSGLAEAWLTSDRGGGFGNYRRRVAMRRGRGGTLSLTEPIQKDGSVEFTLPEGFPTAQISNLTLEVRDAAAGCGEIALDAWPEKPIELRLQPGLRLRGVALDNDGKPVSGLPVVITPVARGRLGGRGRQERPSAVTGQDGRFEIASLLPGDYALFARSGDGGRYTEVLQLDEASAGLLVTLKPATG